jgi:hypothetical protein
MSERRQEIPCLEMQQSYPSIFHLLTDIVRISALKTTTEPAHPPWPHRRTQQKALLSGIELTLGRLVAEPCDETEGGFV